MQLTINLSLKPKGFKEALDVFVACNQVRGMLVEIGVPSLEPYKTPKRVLWRLSQVNPSNVGGELKDPTYDHAANTFTFTLVPFGPRRDMIDHIKIMKCNVALSARMIKNIQGDVTRITAFDLVQAEDHIDTVTDNKGVIQ